MIKYNVKEINYDLGSEFSLKRDYIIFPNGECKDKGSGKFLNCTRSKITFNDNFSIRIDKLVFFQYGNHKFTSIDEMKEFEILHLDNNYSNNDFYNLFPVPKRLFKEFKSLNSLV